MISYMLIFVAENFYISCTTFAKLHDPNFRRGLGEIRSNIINLVPSEKNPILLGRGGGDGWGLVYTWKGVNRPLRVE